MLSRRYTQLSAALITLASLAAAPAFATLDATATIYGVPSGPNYNYTLSVTNTGTQNIGTVWFAWTPPGDPVEYDFLPTLPSSPGYPAGWVAPIANFGIIPNLYSIEYYNISGSPISPGNTGNFTFTSADTPSTLQGSFIGFPIVTSYIYEGFPESGPFTRITPTFVAAPEPSSLLLLALGLTALAPRRRNLSP